MPFEVTYHARCRAPKGAKAAVLKAARAAAASLPRAVLKNLRLGKGTWQIHVTLTTDGEIRRLNRGYRGKDKVTDVLSFSRLEGPRPPIPEVGDVIICGAQARRQAKVWNNTPLKELQRLAVHGTLHLFGYDHERSKKDERIMFALQDRILSRL